MIIDVNHSTPWTAGDTVTAMLRPGITEIIGMPGEGRDKTVQFLTASAVREARTVHCLLENEGMITQLRAQVQAQRGTLKDCVIKRIIPAGNALRRKITRTIIKDMFDTARPGDFSLIDGVFCPQDRNEISHWAAGSRATFTVLAGVLPSMNVPNHDLLIHRSGRRALEATGLNFPEEVRDDMRRLPEEQIILSRDGRLKRIEIVS